MSAGTSKSGSQAPAVTWVGFLYLLVVYVVWGSTFLAIRLTVREGSGFPPFTMAAMRLVVASSLLLTWAGARDQFRISKRDLAILAASGILLWVGGNGLVVWAEQHADSGYTALLMSSIPIFTAVIESILDRRLPSALLTASLLLGLAGLAVLTIPTLVAGAKADTLAVLALLLSSLNWAISSIFQRRNPVRSGSQASSGYQQLFGALGLAVVLLLAREPHPTPTPQAWLAWGYLVVFGSIIAYTSFVMALRTLPTNVVMTHAYVNPVIAMMIGWLFLGEPITIWMVVGAILVLLGVAGVFRDRHLQTSRATISAK